MRGGGGSLGGAVAVAVVGGGRAAVVGEAYPHFARLVGLLFDPCEGAIWKGAGASRGENASPEPSQVISSEPIRLQPPPAFRIS